MKKMSLLLSVFLFAATAVTPANAAIEPRLLEYEKKFEQFPASKGQGTESERLQKLFDLTWDFFVQSSPEMATYLGYPGLNDRWSDSSFESIAWYEQLSPKMLAALKSVDRSKLTEKEKLNYDLALRRMERGLEGERFHGEYLAINQMGGVQQGVPQMLAMMPTANVKDYENIISRLRGVPKVVDQSIALLEKGLEKGITPPKVTLRDLPGQVQNLLVDDPMKSPMLKAFTQFPETVPAAERERLTREAVQAFNEQVAPAYRKLHDYLEKTYVPGTRESIAMSDLPDGQAWYAHNVEGVTTTDLTPKQIHEIGLSEVKRIRGEMDKVIATTGFKGTFEEFLTFLRTDPQFFYDKPEDLLAGYRDISKRVDPELVKLFGKLPRLPYGVIPIPAYAEKSQTTAYYEPGSLQAGRPGYFAANTYDLKSRPKWEMEALTLHEAVPGHHLQLALNQELEDVPEWRKYDDYTAFVEGWGLYAESLGPELGMYKDPYSKFGQLTYEMWRAVRLVVDTGMHSMGWSRQQAIDFFKANAGKAEHDIVVEVDRYIVWPGQALAYKIGELKIKELRAYAQQELGDKFDVRAFHDQVLGRGSLPLDVLESNIREWVADQKTPKVNRGTEPVGKP